MCITAKKADMSKTQILCLALENGNRFMAYSNKVKNTSGKPNAMIIAIPGTTKQEWFRDTTGYKGFLDEIVEKAGKDEWLGLRSRGLLTKSLSLDIFELGMYTIGLTDSFAGVNEFISSLPEKKRFEISEALSAFFQEQYKGWSFAVCCFDSEKTIDAQPIALEYVPFDQELLFFPTIDAHDGGAPDLKAMVDVDHTFIFEHAGVFEVEGRFKRRYAIEAVELDAAVPDFLKKRKYRFIQQKGRQVNGDTFINIPLMRGMEILDDPSLLRMVLAPREATA